MNKIIELMGEFERNFSNKRDLKEIENKLYALYNQGRKDGIAAAAIECHNSIQPMGPYFKNLINSNVT